MTHSKRQKLSVEDVNNALKMRSVEPLYGYDPGEALQFRLVPNTNLFYVADEEVDFETLLNAPLPKVPLKPTFSVHWLAVEGVQPQIPENPVEVSLATDTLQPPTNKKDILQISHEDTEVRPPVKHVLSKELQLYYEKITNFLASEDPEEQQIALECIGKDSGIQQLVPYFIQFASENVTKYLRNLSVVSKMVSLLEKLFENEHLFMEPYLHQCMPCLLTCILAKRLCEDPSEPHWDCRRRSAKLVGKICKQYKDSYNTLVPRVTKTLTKALFDLQKPASTRFGSICGISALGREPILSIILPNLKSLQSSFSKLEMSEATHLQSELLHALKTAKESFDEMEEKERESNPQYLELCSFIFSNASNEPKQVEDVDMEFDGMEFE